MILRRPGICDESPPTWHRGAILETFWSSQKAVSMEVFPGVSMDPDIRFGKPCLTGTRIDVATIVGAIAAGEMVETVATAYALSVDQVRSALRYAAHIAAHLPPAVRQAS